MTGLRDVREVIREEPLMRAAVLEALGDGPRTIPEIAAAIGHPAREVTFWVMGMRRYGYLREADAAPDGHFRYQRAEAAR